MTAEVSDFIEQHASKSTSEVALLLSKKDHLPKQYILNQINGRQKAKQKLPFLSHFKDFEFPSSKAVAQSSSETTALYKTSLVKGKSCADLSGGMGVDSYFFSKQFETVHYIEQDPDLSTLTAKNLTVLGATNITAHLTDAESFLTATKHKFDLIFIDPDRKSIKEKAVRIEDCEPNVLDLLSTVWEKATTCMIKLSPMLDIHLALEKLIECKEVHVVSVGNDCKELLFVLEKDYEGTTVIKTINFNKKTNETFEFTSTEEKGSASDYTLPKQYLYEPNSSILKAGAFKIIGDKFGLYKLATNTHLYTSDELIKNFPGRTIKVEKVSKPQKGFTDKANIICRNFNLKPEQIKKKYKIKDGGSQFLYACTLQAKEKAFILGTLL